MTDEVTVGGSATADGEPACPWCSARLATAAEARCSSCGAVLHEDAVDEIPGVTQVDIEAIVRSRRSASRSRGLIGWLLFGSNGQPRSVSGSVPVAGPSLPPAPSEAFAPPPNEVRREMRRLEMQALEAEDRTRNVEGGMDLPGHDGVTIGREVDADNPGGDPAGGDGAPGDPLNPGDPLSPGDPPSPGNADRTAR